MQYTEFRKRFCIGMLVVALLGTLFHFVYDLFGQNWLVGLFFPVNESTWEHMKLVFWPMVLLNLYISARYKNSDYPVEPAALAGTVVGLIGIPVLFYTYRGILGYGRPFCDVAVYYVSLLIAALTVLHLVKHMFWKDGKWLAIVLWIVHLIFAAMFFAFTYNPPQLGIFREML